MSIDGDDVSDAAFPTLDSGACFACRWLATLGFQNG